MENKNIPLTNVVNKVKQMANYNNDAKKLALKHKLDIVTVTYEDNARFKKSIWGPCISDMTLQVNNDRMPVIREPNYTDKTWDVNIEKIPIVIGNECDDEKQNISSLQTISLKQYLSQFDQYITKQIENTSINLLRKNNKDTHVIMSSQCCFLPIESSKQTKFNIALFNYQSKLKDPAVLIIVSTSKGTSAQIIEGNQQKLLFNNHGKKADFIGQRLTDNRIEKGLEIEGPMNKEEKQENCIVIIQVPLKQKSKSFKSAPPLPPPQQPPFAAFYGGIQSEQQNYKNLKKRSLPFNNKEKEKENDDTTNVESAIIKISDALYPVCICGSELQKYQLQYAYMSGNNLNTGHITCDECDVKIQEKTEIVWHCIKEKVGIHQYGYDLCGKCGEKQLNFDELNGIKMIERDEKYPIRVTLQYYKSTDNGVINDEIMKDIQTLLIKSQSQADFIGSLVIDDKKENDYIQRPTEPELNNNNNNPSNIGYTKIFEALKQFGGKDWQKYYEKFLDEEVNDQDILILNDEDLKELIPKIGPRSRIKKWITNRKQNESPVNFMEGIL